MTATSLNRDRGPGTTGSASDAATRVVLVGAGHTHVQLLRHWIMAPHPAIDATLVVDTPIAVYSGMAPGLVAGQYQRHELEIDAVPLARRAGVRVVLAPCVGVEAAGRRVLVEGREPLPFDVASFDVGSTVAGLDLPGVREHAVPTRPINRLAAAIDDRVEALTGERPHVVVVGSGAGGIELAFCIDARLRRQGLQAEDDDCRGGRGHPAGLSPFPVATDRGRGPAARHRDDLRQDRCLG